MAQKLDRVDERRRHRFRSDEKDYKDMEDMVNMGNAMEQIMWAVEPLQQRPTTQRESELLELFINSRQETWQRMEHLEGGWQT